MAGHSKWANIKHRKARQDAKKGAVFTKIIRELTVAAKEGGGIVEDNPRLRLAYDKALSANMTKDTINRAIQRGAGGQEGQNLEEVIYEGYAPGGVAVLVKTLTDNRNRTVSEVRHAFTKFGGNLGTSGSVAYLFDSFGKILEQSSFAILTREADAQMSAIHHRQPLFINENQLGEWLFDTEMKIVDELMMSSRSLKLSAWPVSSRINNAQNKGAECNEVVGPVSELDLVG